jgi:hypothetical protein
VALVADLGATAPAGLWLRLLELVAEAEMNLRQSVDARLLVEVCLLRALRPPAADGESAGVAALEARIGALERGGRVSSGPGPEPAASAPAEPTGADATVQTATQSPNPAAAPSEVVVEAIGRRDLSTGDGWIAEWPVAIEAVARVNKGLAGVLRDCRPVDADEAGVTIGTQGRFHLEQISDPEKRAVIAAALSTIAGRRIEVNTRFLGDERHRGDVSGTVSDITQAVLDTFAGSRVTATRLHDDTRLGTPRSVNGG